MPAVSPRADQLTYWQARTAGQGTPLGITTDATGLQDLDTDASTNLRAIPGAHVKQPVMKAQVVEDADFVTRVLVCDPGDTAASAPTPFARSEQTGDTREQEHEHV